MYASGFLRSGRGTRACCGVADGETRLFLLVNDADEIPEVTVVLNNYGC